MIERGGQVIADRYPTDLNTYHNNYGRPMKSLITVICVAFSMLLVASDAYADSPKATLEFRLAVADAADGYSEHAVADSDDVVYVADETVLTGRDIEKVSFSEDAKGYPIVGLVLTDDASNKFFTATSENVGKKLAILLDGRVVSAPIIRAAIKKEVSITGNFDDKDILRFFTAIVLRRMPAAVNAHNGG